MLQYTRNKRRTTLCIIKAGARSAELTIIFLSTFFIVRSLRFFPKSKVRTIQHINKTGHLKITYNRGERRT